MSVGTFRSVCFSSQRNYLCTYIAEDHFPSQDNKLLNYRNGTGKSHFHFYRPVFGTTYFRPRPLWSSPNSAGFCTGPTYDTEVADPEPGPQLVNGCY